MKLRPNNFKESPGQYARGEFSRRHFSVLHKLTVHKWKRKYSKIRCLAKNWSEALRLRSNWRGHSLHQASGWSPSWQPPRITFFDLTDIVNVMWSNCKLRERSFYHPSLPWPFPTYTSFHFPSYNLILPPRYVLSTTFRPNFATQIGALAVVVIYGQSLT